MTRSSCESLSGNWYPTPAPALTLAHPRYTHSAWARGGDSLLLLGGSSSGYSDTTELVSWASGHTQEAFKLSYNTR